jgi:hypothetical protein
MKRIALLVILSTTACKKTESHESPASKPAVSDD